jgi:membrane-bound lytic murein transglycosylase B
VNPYREVHSVRQPARATLRCNAAALGIAMLVTGSNVAAAADGFSQWLAEFQSEAIERGISEPTVRTALAGIQPNPRVLELDRTQPGGKPSDFCQYMERRLTPTRIARGRRVLAEESVLLAQLTDEYGVPARYLVALWGLETNFGDYTGDYPVIASLATLAHDPRRADLFRRQLFAALRIVDEGHQTAAGYKGSWAGASGNVQFMPTTFLSYAVDHDGDGRKDLWDNRADSLASAANYLRRSGWRTGEAWGRQVTLPEALERDPASLRQRRSLSDWQELGVTKSNGGALPEANMRGRIVQPLRGPGPAFLAYANYEAFLAWNNSTYFAVSVGTFADELGDRSSLRACGL